MLYRDESISSKAGGKWLGVNQQEAGEGAFSADLHL